MPPGLPRWFNVLAAALALSLLAPLLALISLVVRLDSRGGACFRQVRVGLNGRCFVCLKFRTMAVRAATPAGTIADFTDFTYSPPHARRDRRLTRIGVALRRSSVDELPQLLNVIRGEMALIGPRPELPEIVAQYPAAFHRRHRVLPGISGLAQVNGRSDLTYGETITYDLEYVDYRSARFDLTLLAQTARVVIERRGAR